MSERLRYTEVSPEGIAQMRGLEHYLNSATALPAVLLELVRLRVSLVNGCDFCVGHHTRELEKHNEPASRMEALRDWAGSDAFTPRERSALAWADSVTAIGTARASEPEYAEVSTYFAPKDLVDLTMTIASINAWNRMSIAFRATWDPEKGPKRSGNPGDNDRPVTSGRGGSKETASAPAVSLPDLHGSGNDSSTTQPARPETPVRDVVDDDGGKVAQD